MGEIIHLPLNEGKDFKEDVIKHIREGNYKGMVVAFLIDGG
jgi:hypothetical protein